MFIYNIPFEILHTAIVGYFSESSAQSFVHLLKLQTLYERCPSLQGSAALVLTLPARVTKLLSPYIATYLPPSPHHSLVPRCFAPQRCNIGYSTAQFVRLC